MVCEFCKYLHIDFLLVVVDYNKEPLAKTFVRFRQRRFKVKTGCKQVKSSLLEKVDIRSEQIVFIDKLSSGTLF